MPTLSESILHILRVKEAGELNNRYIHGPRTPQEVRKLGYHFCQLAWHAWPFPNARQAAHKARIVERHMSKPQGWIELVPARRNAQGILVVITAEPSPPAES